MVDPQKTTKGVRKRQSRAEAYCTHHCSVCKGHFSSLAAFDAHRVGSFKPDERRCIDLDEYRELQPENTKRYKERTGICELTKGVTLLEGVSIWGGAGDRPRFEAADMSTSDGLGA